MYCVKCGSLVQANLNFCNSCGARIGKEDTQAAKAVNPLSYLVTALCIIGVGGLLLLVGLIVLLLDRKVDDKVIAAISTMFLFVLLCTNFMLLRQISRLIGTHIENKESKSEKQPANLFSHTTSQLEAPRQPVTSVTDHTTRILDEVLIREK